MEAHVIAISARSRVDKSLQRKAVERVQAFLKKDADAEVQLALAELLYDLREYEGCEKLIDVALPKLDQSVSRSAAHYYRGEARIERGQIEEGKKDLQAALELLQPNQGYHGVYPETIRRRLQAATDRPAAPGLSWRQHVMEGWHTPIEHGLELAGGRALYLDDLRRLCGWDPIQEKGAVFTLLPNRVRDFMPLDRTRVFVAFLDGAAALYEEGREAPVWKRDLPLGFNSYLCASARAITAADEKGALHVLDPQTGKTLWSRNIPGKPWPEHWWRSERSLIRQQGDRVLIPDQVERARTIECVQTSTGRTLWSHPTAFGVDQLAASETLLVMAGRDGDLAAVSLADGKVLWQKRVEAKVAFPHVGLAVALSPDDKHVYLAAKETFRCLSAATGEVQWTWKWQPLEGTLSKTRGLVSVQLCPTATMLYGVLNWDADDRERPNRTDVVVLTREGKLRLQKTAPRSLPEYAYDPFVQDDTLFFRRRAYWERWDFSGLKDRP